MTIIEKIKEFFDPGISSVVAGRTDPDGTCRIIVRYKYRVPRTIVCRHGDCKMAANKLALLLYNYHLKKMACQKRNRSYMK